VVVAVRRKEPTMLAGNEIEAPDPTTLEARERDLTRRVLSLICRTTGRRRTPDECRHLDALVGEIRAVRHARREATRAP
jgi:hypothetical protein